MVQEIDFEDELLDSEGGAEEPPLSGAPPGTSTDHGGLAETTKIHVSRTGVNEGARQSRRQESHGQAAQQQGEARRQKDTYGGEVNLDADRKPRPLPTSSTSTTDNEEPNDWPGVVENQASRKVLEQSRGESEQRRYSSGAYHTHGGRVEVEQGARERGIEAGDAHPGVVDHAIPKGRNQDDAWRNGERSRGGGVTGDRRQEWEGVRHGRAEERRGGAGGRGDWNSLDEGGLVRGGRTDKTRRIDGSNSRFGDSSRERRATEESPENFRDSSKRRDEDGSETYQRGDHQRGGSSGFEGGWQQGRYGVEGVSPGKTASWGGDRRTARGREGRLEVEMTERQQQQQQLRETAARTRELETKVRSPRQFRHRRAKRLWRMGIYLSPC